MTVANYVTLSRIVLIPLVIILMLVKINGFAVIVFLILSFSDAIDGYIARRYNQVSELGKFLDPLADKVLVISVLILLVGMGRADYLPVLLIVVRELIVQGIRIHSAKDQKIIAASPVAKWKTGAQIVAVAMLMLRLPYANWVLWLAVVLGYISGGGYLWQSKILKQLKLS